MTKANKDKPKSSGNTAPKYSDQVEKEIREARKQIREDKKILDNYSFAPGGNNYSCS